MLTIYMYNNNIFFKKINIYIVIISIKHMFYLIKRMLIMHFTDHSASYSSIVFYTQIICIVNTLIDNTVVHV